MEQNKMNGMKEPQRGMAVESCPRAGRGPAGSGRLSRRWPGGPRAASSARAERDGLFSAKAAQFRPGTGLLLHPRTAAAVSRCPSLPCSASCRSGTKKHLKIQPVLTHTERRKIRRGFKIFFFFNS